MSDVTMRIVFLRRRDHTAWPLGEVVVTNGLFEDQLIGMVRNFVGAFGLWSTYVDSSVWPAFVPCAVLAVWLLYLALNVVFVIALLVSVSTLIGSAHDLASQTP